jgi:hypothetical protein
MVDRNAISKINRKVSRKFPELSGTRPTVSRQSVPNGSFRYLLIYRAKVKLPGGKSLNRIVRVTTDARGRILRMSTSR